MVNKMEKINKKYILKMKISKIIYKNYIFYFFEVYWRNIL